nr:MAG TPA: hypothetical protein [Caudoviricetes sp.]
MFLDIILVKLIEKIFLSSLFFFIYFSSKS